METKPLPTDKPTPEIEEKIDEFNQDSFPASDPPNWSSLQHLAKKAKKDGK